MILPQPESLSQYHRFPLTWTLLLLNILIYFTFFAGQPESFNNQKILQTTSTVVTGRLYSQFLQSLTPKLRAERPSWALKLSPDVSEHMEILGAYSLRDGEFLKASQTMKFAGDDVAIENWRVDMAAFVRQYGEDTTYGYGLNNLELKSWTWITYQFSHAGIVHLFSNMLFLVVIGTAVETLVGGFGLLFLYVAGGIVGGAAFLLYNGHAVTPMVGASASISALLSFYFVVEARKRIRFVYFISPFAGHNGFIYLPTLLIFPLFMLVDFTNLIANPDGLGGSVAYSAHVGGSLLGILTGVVARWVFHVQRPLVVDPILPAEQSRDGEYSP